MSIVDERKRLSRDAKRRYASAAFVTLLLLSVFWPSPVVSSNRLWFGERLAVDELSFLGREAPSWDVAFWFFAGLLLLAILQSAESYEWRVVAFRRPSVRHALIALLVGGVLTAGVWLAIDRPLLAWAEAAQSDRTEATIRIMNRLGGGMNPPLIVLFFLIAGVCYRERRWVAYAVAMAISGLTAGILAQIVKHLVGRARPELWLGPAHYAPGSSTSFPSGHTVGAFAIAGVLMFASRNRPLRVVAFLLALAVGLSRVFAFRHWGSDVFASMTLGLAAAWLAVEIVIPLTPVSAARP
ncbi:MAG TPA: phosphatase PAP2 family protein [Thermoanaerobaculia bacterium]|nr:phosphatase PAP2 family protein [Thermoanaerobaculia bacterium]